MKSKTLDRHFAAAKFQLITISRDIRKEGEPTVYIPLNARMFMWKTKKKKI